MTEPGANLFKRLVCAVRGHKPRRAYQVWSEEWQTWQPMSDAVRIAVCERCGGQLSGWTLTVR